MKEIKKSQININCRGTAGYRLGTNEYTLCNSKKLVTRIEDGPGWAVHVLQGPGLPSCDIQRYPLQRKPVLVAKQSTGSLVFGIYRTSRIRGLFTPHGNKNPRKIGIEIVEISSPNSHNF